MFISSRNYPCQFNIQSAKQAGDSSHFVFNIVIHTDITNPYSLRLDKEVLAVSCNKRTLPYEKKDDYLESLKADEKC